MKYLFALAIGVLAVVLSNAQDSSVVYTRVDSTTVHIGFDDNRAVVSDVDTSLQLFSQYRPFFNYPSQNLGNFGSDFNHLALSSVRSLLF